MKLYFSTIFAVLFFATAAFSSPNTQLREHALVSSVIQKYIQGTYEGDQDKLRNVFHENAVMNGYLGGKLLLATPKVFIQDAGKMQLKKNNADYSANIVSISVDGQVASVILHESGFPAGMSFTNYFHLLDDGNGWKIISKTFTSK